MPLPLLSANSWLVSKYILMAQVPSLWAVGHQSGVLGTVQRWGGRGQCGGRQHPKSLANAKIQSQDVHVSAFSRLHKTLFVPVGEKRENRLLSLVLPFL